MVMELRVPPGSRLNPLPTPAIEVAERPREPLWKSVSPRPWRRSSATNPVPSRHRATDMFFQKAMPQLIAPPSRWDVSPCSRIPYGAAEQLGLVRPIMSGAG